MKHLDTESDDHMTADQGPVVQSAILRGELVRLRKKSKLTQEEVARGLEWSPSKLIRVEGGHSSITKVDLDALLTRYGVTSEGDRQRLHDLNRGARTTGWWDSYRNEISGPYLTYVGYEAGASFVRQFPGTVVPGLLQTAEYAEALTTSAVEAMRVAPVVKLRLRRQSELAQRSTPPRQYYVLDEAVIRRHIGFETDPAIMPNQLRYIADTAARDQLITVRVIPFKAGAHAGLSGAFTLLEFDGDLPDLLYLDPGRGELAIITNESAQVTEYADNFENLLDRALTESDSIAFIRNAAEDMSLCQYNTLKPTSFFAPECRIGISSQGGNVFQPGIKDYAA
jgi:transcriptional regulator with XRE-family HTH domain